MRRLAALALVAAPMPALAQETTPRDLSTDRPDKTESPYTVPAGLVQIELEAASYTRDRAGTVLTETVAIAPVNLKLGIGRNTDLQLIVEPYLHQRVSARGRDARQAIDGVGDVTLRLKRNLWGNDGGATAFALMPFVTLPTSAQGLGTGRVEFGIIAPLAIELSQTVGLGLMSEVDVVENDAANGYRVNVINSATLGFSLTDRLGIYTELFTERGADWIVTGDIGLTYALADTIQFDTGINLGLTDAADDLAVFLGVSRRF